MAGMGWLQRRSTLDARRLVAALASGVLHPGWRGQRPSGRLTFMRLASLSAHILPIHAIDP